MVKKIVSLYPIFFSKIVYLYRFKRYIFEYRCPTLGYTLHARPHCCCGKGIRTLPHQSSGAVQETEANPRKEEKEATTTRRRESLQEQIGVEERTDAQSRADRDELPQATQERRQENSRRLLQSMRSSEARRSRWRSLENWVIASDDLAQEILQACQGHWRR